MAPRFSTGEIAPFTRIYIVVEKYMAPITGYTNGRIFE